MTNDEYPILTDDHPLGWKPTIYMYNWDYEIEENWRLSLRQRKRGELRFPLLR